MKELVNQINKRSEVSLNLHIKKTKLIAISKTLRVNARLVIKRAKEYTLPPNALGASINEQWGNVAKIKAKLEQAHIDRFRTFVFDSA